MPGDSGAMFGGGDGAGGFGGIDFSKLGAGQDLSGLAGLGGGPDMSGIKAGMGDADSDDGEDDEMPDLEDGKDEPAAGDKASGESKPKIEEVA